MMRHVRVCGMPLPIFVHAGASGGAHPPPQLRQPTCQRSTSLGLRQVWGDGDLMLPLPQGGEEIGNIHQIQRETVRAAGETPQITNRCLGLSIQ